MLKKMQINLESSDEGIKPYSESSNDTDVQVVKNPLTGNESWSFKNIPTAGYRHMTDDILWSNCPTSPRNSITQNNIDNVLKEGLGIGFINSLLPGHHIAIIVKSEDHHGIEITITLKFHACTKVIAIVRKWNEVPMACERGNVNYSLTRCTVVVIVPSKAYTGVGQM
ncbi:hypothetical protein BDQ17DRAFT_1335499 [Cyathus striatus]|nr:hypothetical protein BDQ17DRAFT_1335499 [Cyathus striatus]